MLSSRDYALHTKFVNVGTVNIRLLLGRPVESPMQWGEISLKVEEQVKEENLVNSEGNIKSQYALKY